MSKQAKVSLRGLYKIFGTDGEAALEHVRNGMDKEQLLAEHKHVIGLNDINVDMQAGEITVVMGLSGSGKSTLIRHLNRLIEPTTGEVLVDGEDVTQMSTSELRELRQTKMSMVFQKFALLPHRTVVQNAAMPLAVRGVPKPKRMAEAEKWLDRVGLSGFEKHYPAQLSGGMQQRVGIARALTANTDIMLMDEAFSALDPLIRTDMQSLLLELQEELQKTIVFITHDLDEALRLADHLVILNNGAVVQQGNPQHILLNPADPYIEEFVSDINRARVLRVSSVMQPFNADNSFSGDVSPTDNLESLIAQSKGDTTMRYRVVEEGECVGEIDMSDLVKALVPSIPSTSV